MAETWNDYFDHYLEGKKIETAGAKTNAATSTTDGWEARKGTLTAKDGVFILTPDKADRPSFITKAKLKLRGPVAANITLKTAASGKGFIAWRMDGDNDFLPVNRTTFSVTASTDWQTHQLEIPATGSIIHLRVHLPVGAAEFRTLDFKSAPR